MTYIIEQLAHIPEIHDLIDTLVDCSEFEIAMFVNLLENKDY